MSDNPERKKCMWCGHTLVLYSTKETCKGTIYYYRCLRCRRFQQENDFDPDWQLDPCDDEDYDDYEEIEEEEWG